MPYLIVKNQSQTLFEGLVDNISAYNKKGLFDILTDHSNFISILEKKIIIRNKSLQQEIPFDNALIKVKGNNIYVYVGVY